MKPATIFSFVFWCFQSIAQQVDDSSNYFLHYWEAATSEQKQEASQKILSSGLSFDRVYHELQTGRSYSSRVKRGFLTWDRKTPNGIQLYALIFIPHDYTPERKYPVRVTLHGGISSMDPYNVHHFVNTTLSDYDSVQEIRIYPSAYFLARWYTALQYDNVMYLLDRVKKIYNVDENRVSLVGYSDGGTGTFAFANYDVTPYSCFLPFIGSCAGLAEQGTKEFYFNNMRNKPMFIENGKLDQTFSAPVVLPYVSVIQQINPNVTFYFIDTSGHSLAWMKSLKDTVDRFIIAHPRNPFPDHIMWQTETENKFNRNHWVIINRIGKTKSNSDDLKDVNTITWDGKEYAAFRRDSASGIIEAKQTGNTIEMKTKNVREFTLLLSPGQFDFSRPLKVFTNGLLSYEGMPEKNTSTVLNWNERDNDRTMLFAAELKIRVGKEFKAK